MRILGTGSTRIRRNFQRLNFLTKGLRRPLHKYEFTGAGTTDAIEMPEVFETGKTFVVVNGTRTRKEGTDYTVQNDAHGVPLYIVPANVNVFPSGGDCVFWYTPRSVTIAGG